MQISGALSLLHSLFSSILPPQIPAMSAFLNANTSFTAALHLSSPSHTMVLESASRQKARAIVGLTLFLSFLARL